jgi:hypothetical protein
MIQPTRKTGGEIAWAIVLVLAFLTGSAHPARAYIDAGSGSYLFQLLIAGFVGTVYTVKVFWKRIRGFFGGRMGAQRSEVDDR